MRNRFGNYLLLHIIVFIWGWTPIFGRLISVQALQLVWFRILFTLMAVAGYLVYVNQNLRILRVNLLKLFMVGAIIAFHWVCFYHAIKISNVSITLAAFSTGTLFSALLEPLFYKRKIMWYELIFGLIIVAAIVMILKVETNYTLGIIFGIFAAFTSALFTVCNGLLVRKMEPPIIVFYELSGGFVVLSLYLLLKGAFTPIFFQLSFADIEWLIIFATVATAFPFIASVNVLKKINPYTLMLTVNLEMVYGIIWAYFLFQENKQVTTSFYIGTVIILATIFANGILKRYSIKQND